MSQPSEWGTQIFAVTKLELLHKIVYCVTQNNITARTVLDGLQKYLKRLAFKNVFQKYPFEISHFFQDLHVSQSIGGIR
jgi:hypothetical protein